MTKGLLLIAHGSRRGQANDEFLKLAQDVGRKIGAMPVVACFLELQSPDIPGGIEELIRQQVTTVVILPYFLSNGNHTAVDIPQIVAQKQSEHPNIRFEVLPPIGTMPQMIDLIIQRATKS